MFSADGAVTGGKKKVPLSLDMNKYVLRTTQMMLEDLKADDCKYELYAVVSCEGDSLEECQYKTTVKTLDIQKQKLMWIEYKKGVRRAVHEQKVARD